MLHRFTTAFACACAVLLCAVPAPRAQAGPFDVTVSGTVISLTAANTTTGLRDLSINTRLGPRIVEIGATTLLLLNNHTTTATSITVGLKAEVVYNYATLLAKQVKIFNETKITGKVVSATPTSVTIRKSGANITLTTNTGSVLDLNGIPVSNPAVLVGQKGTFVYEPGSNLVLSSEASATLVKNATLTSVNTSTNQLTVGGTQPLTFTLDTSATILRNGVVVPLTSLVAGDRLRIAFTKDVTNPNSPVLRLLALEASPLTNPTPAKK